MSVSVRAAARTGGRGSATGGRAANAGSGVPTPFEEAVYAATAMIPRGKVATYASVARAMGRPEAVRAVGNALGKNPYPHIPCHRVVRSSGHVGGFTAPGGWRAKAGRLREEGVALRGPYIADMERYAVDPGRLRRRHEKIVARNQAQSGGRRGGGPLRGRARAGEGGRRGLA